MRKIILAGAALAATACASLYTPPPTWDNEPEATRIAERWFESSQGFDSLAAWEVRSQQQVLQFAVARKWGGPDVKILAYGLSPVSIEDGAMLVHLQPGQLGDVWTRLPASFFRRAGSNVGKNYTRITHTRGVSLGPGGGTLSVAGEVVVPSLATDHAFRRVPDETVDGEPCSVIESRPLLEKRRGHDRIVYWISQKSGAALRKDYYRGTHQLRRVEVRPADVTQTEGRLEISQLLVKDAEEGTFLLLLRNSVPDVELADSLFTKRTLEIRRWPRF